MFAQYPAILFEQAWSIKAGFSLKRRVWWSSKNSVLISLTTLSFAHGLVKTCQRVVGVASTSGRTKPIRKRRNEHSDWCILLLLLPTPKIWFSQDRKRRSYKRSRNNGNVLILPTPIPCCSYDFAYNSYYFSYPLVKKITGKNKSSNSVPSFSNFNTILNYS